jgi:hypothetical protein
MVACASFTSYVTIKGIILSELEAAMSAMEGWGGEIKK